MYKKLIPGLVVVLAVAATVGAQTVFDPQTQPAAAVTGAPAAGAAQLDQAIATCLVLGNLEEVALAQFAQGRASSDEVKQFVEMVIRDHRAAIEKITAMAPQVASIRLRAQAREGAGAAPAAGQPAIGQPPTGIPAAGAAPAGGPAGLPSSLTALQVRIAQECLDLTQRELGEREGAEFDQCFVGQQIGAHVAMLAKLRGSREFASPELQTVIQAAEQTVQRHLDEAKDLAEKLMADARQRGEGDQAARDQSRRQ